MSRVLSPRARSILDLQPPALRKQALFQACAAAQGEQLDKLDAAIDALTGLVIPKSAGDYLYIWESIAGVTVSPTATQSERLDVVLAFLSRMTSEGTGANWVAVANRLIGTGWTYRTRQASPFLTRNHLLDPRGTALAQWAQVNGGSFSGSAASTGDADLDGKGLLMTLGTATAGQDWIPVRSIAGPAGDRAVTPGKWYGIRARLKIVSSNVPFGSAWRLHATWRDASGAPLTAASGDPLAQQVPNASTYGPGAILDLAGKVQAPAGAARPGLSVQLSPMGGSTSAQVKVGRFMVTELPSADANVPGYGGGATDGWVWEGAADASPSYLPITDNPIAHHVTVYLGSGPSGALSYQSASKLFNAITPANTVVDIANVDMLIMDSSTGGLMDKGQLG